MCCERGGQGSQLRSRGLGGGQAAHLVGEGARVVEGEGGHGFGPAGEDHLAALAAPGQSLVPDLHDVGARLHHHRVRQRRDAALGPVHPTNYAREANIFLHLLDSDGNFIAGNDRLRAPAWNWQAGEGFAQIHRLSLPPNLAPGAYRLQVGIYTLPDLIRLPRLDANADTAKLGEIRVEP